MLGCMGTAPRPRPWLHLRPDTASGWAALAILAGAAALLLARVLLKPALGLPLNYLVVFIAVVAAGLVALYATIVRRERSSGVIVTLALGAIAGIVLVLETINPPGS